MPCFKSLDKRQISVKFTGLFSANTKKYYNFSRNPEIMFSGVRIGEKYDGIRWGTTHLTHPNWSIFWTQKWNMLHMMRVRVSRKCYASTSDFHRGTAIISTTCRSTTQLVTSCAEQISPWQQWVSAQPHTRYMKWSNQITQEVRRETVNKAWPGSGERINKGGCGIVTNDMISLIRAVSCEDSV